MYLTCNFNYNNIQQPVFGGVQTQKLIAKLEKAERINKMEITFDQLERMYNEIGFDVVKKRGSHASIQLTPEIIISVIIPHGKKYVNINDLRRFLLVKEGKYKEASLINR